MAEKLTTELFHCMWRDEAIPQDVRHNPPSNGMEILKCVATIGAYLYCQLLGRYRQNPAESPERTYRSDWSSIRQSV